MIRELSRVTPGLEQPQELSLADRQGDLQTLFVRLADAVRPRLAGEESWTVTPMAEWDQLAGVLPSSRPVSRVRETVRRLLEIVLATALLILTSPLIALLGLLVVVDGGWPAFFGHDRVGRNARPFRCWKLRTMRPGTACALAADSEMWAAYVADDFKIRHGEDPRITRIGRLLRATYLDELPQLWNVLRGDMSLIGPRPVVSAELAWYGPLCDEFLSVRPGISGPWQLTDHMPYPERVYVELAYIRARSWSLDLEIVLRTVYALLTGRARPLSELLPITADPDCGGGLSPVRASSDLFAPSSADA